MLDKDAFPLTEIEPRLRTLLPAVLYTDVWLNPSADNLMRVFDHLRSLRYLLQDYLPRVVVESSPNPGEVQYNWEDGTLMFTDLAGFTKMMEANVNRGREGAFVLLEVLNSYFAQMLEILGKSGGNLLEFTGDALLVQFPADKEREDAARAVRAGLRMQNAMNQFINVDTAAGKFTLNMRIGLHRGRFMIANIGTPRRMETVLLGRAVYNTKIAEGAGQIGRVNLTRGTANYIKDQYDFEAGQRGHMLISNTIDLKDVGEYELITSRRRLGRAMLFDRSVPALLKEIEDLVNVVEPLASYLPSSALNLVVESTTRGKIAPSLTNLVVLFVSLLGLPESVGMAREEEEEELISSFSRIFSLINAVVEARGGLLKKVTYQASGSNILIYFGAPNPHTDDTLRAAKTALEIRDIVEAFEPLTVAGRPKKIGLQIGIAEGPAFVAELGVPRGRREFNVLGDTVNTAARLMAKAEKGAIYITDKVCQQIAEQFQCDFLGEIPLKGKTPAPIFALKNKL